MATVTLYKVPPNEHGCSGVAVTIRTITRRKGVVEKVEVCGCGANRAKLAAGEIVALPASFEGTWQQAAQLDDINIHSYESFAEATVVTPDTLLTGFIVQTRPGHVA